MQSRTILNLHSGVPAMAGFCQVWVRERGQGVKEVGLARPINDPGRPPSSLVAIANQHLLSLLELSASLGKGHTIRLQMLVQDHVAFSECRETRLQGRHERGFRSGSLPLIEQGCQAVLEVGEALLAFEHEPFHIG
jgi:hypothetical protein